MGVKLCAILGAAKTGKTEYANRLASLEEFSDEYKESIGLNFLEVYHSDSRTRLQLRDIAGAERFAAVTTAFTKDAEFLIFCLDPHSELEEQIDKLCKQIPAIKEINKKQLPPFSVVITKADVYENDAARKQAFAEIEKQLKDSGLKDYSALEFTSAKENCYYDKEGQQTTSLAIKNNESEKDITGFCTRHGYIDPNLALQQNKDMAKNWKAIYLNNGGNYYTANKIFMDPQNPSQYRKIEDIKLLLQFRKEKRPGGASDAVLKQVNNPENVSPASEKGDQQESEKITPSATQRLCLSYAKNGGSFARAREIFFDKNGAAKSEEDVREALNARKNRLFKLPFFSGASDKTLEDFDTNKKRQKK